MISQIFRRSQIVSKVQQNNFSRQMRSVQSNRNNLENGNEKARINRLLASHRYCFSVGVSHLINPFNKEFVSDKQYISDQMMTERINKVAQQQKQWKKLDVNKRIQLVRKFIDSVVIDEGKLSETIVKQIGKSMRDIRQQFRQLREQGSILLADGIQALQTQTVSSNDQEIVRIVSQPIGLTMIFPHYSEPILDSMIHLIPCLTSGCAALIKSSDYNHFLGPYLERKVQQIIGFDLVADLFIQPQDLHKLSQFRSFKKVVYSGSHSSAKHIFQVLTQKRFIDCNMYFGGQDAIYIDQDADIQKAIDQVMRTAFSNNGQAYDSIKRLYIKEPIYEKVVNILKEKIPQLKLGDPNDLQTHLGPLGIPQSAIRIQQLVNQAVSLGANCLVGGMITSVQAGQGIYFEPTLLTELSNQMSILRTHLPGPVLSCFCVTSDKDFLQNFNDNRFGARVKIFTQTTSPRQILSKYEYLMNNLQVGSITINKGSGHTSNRRLQSWRAATNNRKSSSRCYQQYTILKVFDI